jgi:hypothetical protein
MNLTPAQVRRLKQAGLWEDPENGCWTDGIGMWADEDITEHLEHLAEKDANR